MKSTLDLYPKGRMSIEIQCASLKELDELKTFFSLDEKTELNDRIRFKGHARFFKLKDEKGRGVKVFISGEANANTKAKAQGKAKIQESEN